jgi:hypothetical protein
MIRDTSAQDRPLAKSTGARPWRRWLSGGVIAVVVVVQSRLRLASSVCLRYLAALFPPRDARRGYRGEPGYREPLPQVRRPDDQLQ